MCTGRNAAKSGLMHSCLPVSMLAQCMHLVEGITTLQQLVCSTARQLCWSLGEIAMDAQSCGAVSSWA